MDTFLEEITFFDLGLDALTQVRKDENLEEAKKVQLPSNRFYRHLWANLEYPQYSMTAKIINIFSAIFIFISAITLAVETLPNYRGMYNNRCEQGGDGTMQKEYMKLKFSIFLLGLLINANTTTVHQICSPYFPSPFFIIQSVCIAFFTIEFLLRLISCPSYLDFIKSILNWIDFLAIGKFFFFWIIYKFFIFEI